MGSWVNVFVVGLDVNCVYFKYINNIYVGSLGLVDLFDFVLG